MTMSDAQDDDGVLGFSDAATIGFKIVDMAERVREGIKITGIKGVEAKWVFTLDGRDYEVKVTLRA